jgi:hypothetical protein
MTTTESGDTNVDLLLLLMLQKNLTYPLQRRGKSGRTKRKAPSIFPNGEGNLEELSEKLHLSSPRGKEIWKIEAKNLTYPLQRRGKSRRFKRRTKRRTRPSVKLIGILKAMYSNNKPIN